MSVVHVCLVLGSLCVLGSIWECNGGGVNLALGKPAWQSSQYFAAAPSRNVDGNTNQKHGGGSCIHTTKSGEANPYWFVDLGAVYSIHNVTIWNRGAGCCEGRTHDLLIGVTMTDPALYPAVVPGQYPLCAQYVGDVCIGAVPSLLCTPGTRGRYVIVQLQGPSDVLNICEVQVFEGEAPDIISSFHHVEKDAKLNGTTLGVHSGVSKIQCMALCQRANGCGSVNLSVGPVDSSDMPCTGNDVTDCSMKCELNARCPAYNMYTALGWSYIPV